MGYAGSKNRGDRGYERASRISKAKKQLLDKGSIKINAPQKAAKVTIFTTT